MEEQILNDKRAKRLSNKKRKLAALVNLTQLPSMDEVISETTEIKKTKLSNEEIDDDVGKNSMWLPADSEELAELRKKLQESKKRRHTIPHLRLNEIGEAAEFQKGRSTVPLLLTDVQDLLAFFLTANTFFSPRWCKIDKMSRVSRVALVVVENVNSSTVDNISTLMASDAIMETLLPPMYGGSLVDELAHVPISPACRRRLLEQHGSVEGVLQNHKHMRYKILRAMFPIKTMPSQRVAGRAEVEDRFPRTQLLLDVNQLMDDRYPLPHGALKEKYCNYVFSKEEYTEVSEYSPLFAVDCEMCVTAAGMELTRVSIIDESLTLVYDSLVKPDLPITDYLTKYSGITAKQMKDVTTKLSDVQMKIRDLLPSDAILIGQSLNCDLDALKMMHPYVIDTSIIFNISGSRGRKSKLATLSREFLAETIQDGRGHCSVEDASACMKLVKLKLSNSAEFGDAVLVGRAEAEVHQAAAVAAAGGATMAAVPTCPQITQPLVQCAVEVGRKVAVVGSASVGNGYLSYCTLTSQVTLREVSDAEEGMREAVGVVGTHDATLLHLPQPSNDGQLDTWIQNLWHVLPSCALLILLLTPHTPNDTGLCCLRINKVT